jgi:hypothetical protein
MLLCSRLSLFVAISVLVFLRTLMVRDLNYPWAEDIELLLGSADPSVSLFAPVYDNRLFAQRILARIVEPLIGLENGPFAFYVASALLLAYVSTYMMRDGFAWLIPERSLRALVAIGIALGPGSADVAGSLINTSYTLSLLVLMMSLERSEGHYNRILLASALATTSSHTAFIAAPALLFRSLTEHRRWPFALSFALIASGLTVGGLRNQELLTLLPSTPAPMHLLMGVKYASFWLQSFFVDPFMGRAFAYLLYTVWPLNLALVLLGVRTWIKRCRATSKGVVLASHAIAAGSLLFAVAFIVGRASFYGLGAVDALSLGFSRHNLIYSSVALLSWAPLASWRWLTGSTIGRMALILNVSVIPSLWLSHSPAPMGAWNESVRKLRNYSQSSSIGVNEVRIAPYPSEGLASEVSCRTELETVRCVGTWNHSEHTFLIPRQTLARRYKAPEPCLDPGSCRTTTLDR